MEEAIKLAKSKGYEPIKLYGTETELYSVMLIDPLFWQSLSMALGWEDDHRKEIKQYGGWWEYECKKCGLKKFDFEHDGIQAGYGAGPNGEEIHIINEKGKDCRGRVKSKWHSTNKDWKHYSMEWLKAHFDGQKTEDKFWKELLF